MLSTGVRGCSVLSTGYQFSQCHSLVCQPQAGVNELHVPAFLPSRNKDPRVYPRCYLGQTLPGDSACLHCA